MNNSATLVPTIANYDEGMIPTLDAMHQITDSELSDLALKTLVEAANDDYMTSVAAAQVFNRKGCFSMKELEHESTSSYSPHSDDVVIQVSVRIPFEIATNLLETARENSRVKNAMNAASVAQRKRTLEAERARINAELSNLG